MRPDDLFYDLDDVFTDFERGFIDQTDFLRSAHAAITQLKEGVSMAFRALEDGKDLLLRHAKMTERDFELVRSKLEFSSSR